MTTARAFNTSLRSRIILALVVITTLMSFLLAAGILLIKDRLEEVILGQTVQEQLDILQHQLEEGEYSEQHLFRNWRFYFDETTTVLPARIRNLEPGSHHSVLVDGNYYQVEVGEKAGEKIYLTYDITDWENQEHGMLEMLAYGVGAVILAAVLMGITASKSILAPVNALKNQLASIQPRQRNVRIGSLYAGTEIGLIASAVDQFLGRLDQFVERERSFTAAASHELRTPLSVMIGALDILDTQQLTGPGQRALVRMRRACDEMRAFIVATLFLSREDSNTIDDDADVDFNELLDVLIEDLQPLSDAHQIAISRQVATGLHLQQPRSLLQIITGNILRNAIEHTRNGSIIIVASGDEIRITDTGSGIPEADLPHVFDRSYSTKENGTGLGLNLVKRICDRFNWHISIHSAPGNGTDVSVVFSSPGPTGKI